VALSRRHCSIVISPGIVDSIEMIALRSSGCEIAGVRVHEPLVRGYAFGGCVRGMRRVFRQARPTRV
jgi:hypothetical protein